MSSTSIRSPELYHCNAKVLQFTCIHVHAIVTITFDNNITRDFISLLGNLIFTFNTKTYEINHFYIS